MFQLPAISTLLQTMRTFAGIVHQPKTSFRALAQRPNLWLPVGFSGLALTLAAYFLYAQSSFELEFAAAIRNGELDMDDATVFSAADLLGFWIVVGFLLAALGHWLGSSFVLGRLLPHCGIDLPQTTVRSLVAHALLPHSVGALVLVGSLNLESSYVPTLDGSHEALPWTAYALIESLASTGLFSAQFGPLATRMLAAIDVFSIWSLALLLIAFPEAARAQRLENRPICSVSAIVGVWLVSASGFWIIYP